MPLKHPFENAFHTPFWASHTFNFDTPLLSWANDLFPSDTKTYCGVSNAADYKWQCIFLCGRRITALRCRTQQNSICKHSHVIAFRLFFYDSIQKSCILKASPHMAASSYCHLFKRTFQRLDSSTGATAAYPWNTSMPILHGKTEQLTQWRVQHNSKQHCCHHLPTEHRQAILIKDTGMW